MHTALQPANKQVRARHQSSKHASHSIYLSALPACSAPNADAGSNTAARALTAWHVRIPTSFVAH